jgi:hypothetical protein
MEAWRNRVFEGVEHATNKRNVIENDLSWCVELARKLADENKELLEANKEARKDIQSYCGLYTWAKVQWGLLKRMYLDERSFTKRNLAKIEVLTKQVNQLKMELRNKKKHKFNKSPNVNTNK